MEQEMKYQMEKMPVRCQKYLRNNQKKVTFITMVE